MHVKPVPVSRHQVNGGTVLVKENRIQASKPRRLGTLSVAAAWPSSEAASPTGKEASLAPVLACVVVASLGAFAFGYHLGVVNGPLDAIAASLGFAGDAGKQGAVVSVLLAGAAVGSLSGSGLANSLGRKISLFLTAVPLLLGALLSASASSLEAMLAGRALAGVGIGLASALVPLYISEVAPTKVRGSLGSINQLVICIGILAALVANVFIPATSWATMFYAATVPALLLGVGMLFAPESPRWLAAKGRTSEAFAAAEKLWGPSGPDQLDEADGAGGKAAPKASMGQLLSNKGVLIGCVLFVLQQFSGINAIVYFSSNVFAQAGIKDGALASAAVGVVNVLGTVVAGSLMDRAGRKQLLTLSFALMGTSMLVMSAGLSLPQFASIAGPIALIGTLSYILGFALGAGPVPGLLVPEITPSKIRASAVSLALGTHWVCNFAIGQLFLPAVKQFGVSGVYLFFTAVCVVAILFQRAALVETKGLSLEEIEKAMAAK